MKQKSSRNLFFWLQNGIVVKNLQFNHSVVTFLPTLTPHSPGEEDACVVYFFVLSHGLFCLISQRKQMLLSVISAKWGEIFSNGVAGQHCRSSLDHGRSAPQQAGSGRGGRGCWEIPSREHSHGISGCVRPPSFSWPCPQPGKQRTCLPLQRREMAAVLRSGVGFLSSSEKSCALGRRQLASSRDRNGRHLLPAQPFRIRQR